MVNTQQAHLRTKTLRSDWTLRHSTCLRQECLRQELCYALPAQHVQMLAAVAQTTSVALAMITVASLDARTTARPKHPAGKTAWVGAPDVV